jgi:hypothetical protein
MFLALLNQAMERTNSPIVRLKIATGLGWHARLSPSPEVRELATATVNFVASDAESEFYSAIYPNFARKLPSIDGEADFTALQGKIDHLLSRVVERLLIAFKDPEDLLKYLDQAFDAYTDAGLSASPGWLFVTLANKELEFSEALAYSIVEKYGAKFGRFLSPIFNALWYRKPMSGHAIVDRALESGVVELQRAVAETMWLNNQAISPEDDVLQASVVEKLLRIDDFGVLEIALRACGTIAKRDSKLAMKLILAAPPSREGKVVDELFANLRTIAVSSIDPGITRKLLDRLVAVDELEYWCYEFLKKIAERFSTPIIDLMVRRISIAGDDWQRKSRSSPVAYAGSLLPHVAEFYKALKITPARIERLLNVAFRSKGSQSRYWFAEFFGSLSIHEDAFAAGIDRWISRGDTERLAFAADMMHRVPSNFVFSQRSLVAQILERAVPAGDEVISRVESRFFAAAVSGVRTGVAFEPMPEDLALAKLSADARRELPEGSRAERFFESLQNHALSEISRKAERDEDLFDES